MGRVMQGATLSLLRSSFRLNTRISPSRGRIVRRSLPQVPVTHDLITLQELCIKQATGPGCTVSQLIRIIG